MKEQSNNLKIDDSILVFISRTLTDNSLFKKELSIPNVTIIGQSLVRFSPTPFLHIPKTDWIFFYSKKGVQFFFNAPIIMALLKENPLLKWATIGKGTADELRKYIPVDFVGNGTPKQTAKAFGNIAAGKKVLFPRAQHSKKSIQQVLKNEIDSYDLVVYRNNTRSDFELPFCDILVFTSPLNTIAYFKKYSLQPKQKVVAIGKTTQQTLYELGIINCYVAAKPSEKEMAKVVNAILNQKP